MADKGKNRRRFTFSERGRKLRRTIGAREWKASYVVEASLVFSISLMTIASTLILGFTIYSESVKAVDTRMKEMNAAKVFRMVSEGKDLAARFSDGGD